MRFSQQARVWLPSRPPYTGHSHTIDILLSTVGNFITIFYYFYDETLDISLDVVSLELKVHRMVQCTTIYPLLRFNTYLLYFLKYLKVSPKPIML